MALESGAAQPVAIIGTGRMAQALGRLLRYEGEPIVCVAGRDRARTQHAAAFIGPGVRAVSFAEAATLAPRLLIAVSDSALESVAEALAATAASGGIALHTCGASGIEVLVALQRRGFSCGTLHPLQTVATPAQAASLRGVTFAVSGDEAAVCWARDIVCRIGGTSLAVQPGARPLYHAAAVMASNYVVAVIAAAQEMMSRASGESPDACLRALQPLVRAAVSNAFACGPVEALTGPVERGDARTVASHLGALRRHALSATESLYRAAGLKTLELARTKGLEAANAAQVEAALLDKEQS